MIALTDLQCVCVWGSCSFGGVLVGLDGGVVGVFWLLVGLGGWWLVVWLAFFCVCVG